MPSSINLSNLVNYVNELSADITKEAILKGNFCDQIDHLAGVKNIDALPRITSTLVMTDPTCGTILSPTGSVTMFQNMLTVVESQITEILCKKDFDTKYFGARDARGIDPSNIDSEFAKIYSADKIDKIQAAIEDQIIAGSSTGTFSSVANTNRVNGILHTLTLTSASASVIPAGVTLSYSATTAVGIVDQIIAKRQKATLRKDNVRLWMSYADFLIYITNLRNLNYINYNNLEALGSTKYEVMHPGSNVLVTATSGLDSVSNSNYAHWMFLSPADNLVYGYDDAADYMNFDLSYQSLTRAVHFVANFKVGIQARDYSQIVLAKFN